MKDFYFWEKWGIFSGLKLKFCENCRTINQAVYEILLDIHIHKHL